MGLKRVHALNWELPIWMVWDWSQESNLRRVKLHFGAFGRGFIFQTATIHRKPNCLQLGFLFWKFLNGDEHLRELPLDYTKGEFQ